MISKFGLTKKTISVIGAAWHEGQPKKGTQMAPSQLRSAGLLMALKKTLGYEIIDRGNISEEDLKGLSFNLNDHRPDFSTKKLEFYEPIGLLNEKLSKEVSLAAKANTISLVLGGDHSLAAGSIHGQLSVYGEDLRVIWVDAHADLNNIETSLSGNYHGMPVAQALGLMPRNLPGFNWFSRFLNPKNLVYIGLRDLDEAEKKAIKSLGIKAFSMYDIDDLGGIRNTMESALVHLGVDKDKKPIHLSVDVDACDPSYIKGTGTPVRFGLTEREMIYIMRRTFETGCLVNLDITEINALLEGKSEDLQDHKTIPFVQTNSTTLKTSIEFILYGLGYKDL